MAKKRECKICIAEEEWRPVVGYEGRYEVSSHGRVRSVDIVITDRLGRTRRQAGRELKPKIDKFGYRLFELRNGLGRQVKGGRRNRSAHRMVAQAFISGETAERNEVMHLDHDPSHNCTGNLAWGTHSENVGATVAAGRHGSGSYGKTHCPAGHEYDMLDSRGHRSCRECRRVAQRRHKERLASIA